MKRVGSRPVEPQTAASDRKDTKECVHISLTDDNPSVKFPILDPGYEPLRYFVPLRALFEICVVRTTCFDGSETDLPSGYTKGRRPETSAFLRSMAGSGDNFELLLQSASEKRVGRFDHLIEPSLLAKKWMRRVLDNSEAGLDA